MNPWIKCAVDKKKKWPRTYHPWPHSKAVFSSLSSPHISLERAKEQGKECKACSWPTFAVFFCSVHFPGAVWALSCWRSHWWSPDVSLKGKARALAVHWGHHKYSHGRTYLCRSPKYTESSQLYSFEALNLGEAEFPGTFPYSLFLIWVLSLPPLVGCS